MLPLSTEEGSEHDFYLMEAVSGRIVATPSDVLAVNYTNRTAVWEHGAVWLKAELTGPDSGLVQVHIFVLVIWEAPSLISVHFAVTIDVQSI
jgi:hypothetical protein